MKDGGWNCLSYNGAMHSSLHTTIIVLEGLREYEKTYPIGVAVVKERQKRGREFLLKHKLFRSYRTGKIIDPKMTGLSFPPRWKYDILRCLDYFRDCDSLKDPRMKDAMGIIMKKQRKDGTWPVQYNHQGRT